MTHWIEIAQDIANGIPPPYEIPGKIHVDCRYPRPLRSGAHGVLKIDPLAQIHVVTLPGMAVTRAVFRDGISNRLQLNAIRSARTLHAAPVLNFANGAVAQSTWAIILGNCVMPVWYNFFP